MGQERLLPRVVPVETTGLKEGAPSRRKGERVSCINL